MLASATLAAGVGWLYERRCRLQLEIQRDTALWPSIRQPLRSGPPQQSLDDILTDRRDAEESARSIYPSAIGETTSRREATLIDLHELWDKLRALREQHDITSATELLEEHIADFRYTSPWVFLELREQYKQLERPDAWSMAREAFRKRFGQNAPQWAAASTAADEIANDEQLCQELLRKWPRREARMFILRWMLGDAQTRQKNSGPPQLSLGVYRDMLFLDAVLDQAIAAGSATPPVLVTPA